MNDRRLANRRVTADHARESIAARRERDVVAQRGRALLRDLHGARADDDAVRERAPPRAAWSGVEMPKPA